MKEVSSCQENIDTEAINEKKKSWIGCSTKWDFLLVKSAQFPWKYWPGSNQKAYQIIPIWVLSQYWAFLHFSYGQPFFNERSSPWRSVAEASPVNHERFPGRDIQKARQTWFARSGTRVAELGSPAGFQIGHQNLAAAVKKVVELMSKWSLVLDMVDVQDVEQTSWIDSNGMCIEICL